MNLIDYIDLEELQDLSTGLEDLTPKANELVDSGLINYLEAKELLLGKLIPRELTFRELRESTQRIRDDGETLS